MPDSLYSLLWHLPTLADEISGNTEVRIIDSCIDSNNDALINKITNQTYIDDCKKFINNIPDSSSQYYVHGSCMAGIIGAKETILKSDNYFYQNQYTHFKVLGVAKDAYFKPIANKPNFDDITQLIDTLYNKTTNSKVQYFPKMPRAELTIINSSGGQKKIGMRPTDWWNFLTKLCDNGMDNQIIVASSGNDGLNLTTHYSSGPLPAASKNPTACQKKNMKHVLSVACLNSTIHNSDAALCTKSNYSNQYVDLAAPGAYIPCPIPNNLS